MSQWTSGTSGVTCCGWYAVVRVGEPILGLLLRRFRRFQNERGVRPRVGRPHSHSLPLVAQAEARLGPVHTKGFVRGTL